MKNLVVYYTKSGNTKKLADVIGEELNCAVASVETPITETVELLFLGTAVYKFGIDKKVVEYINSLDASKIGAVAIFATSASSEAAYGKMAGLLKAKGIKVLDKNFFCRSKFLMVNKDRPNADDFSNIKKFAREIVAD